MKYVELKKSKQESVKAINEAIHSYFETNFEKDIPFSIWNSKTGKRMFDGKKIICHNGMVYWCEYKYSDNEDGYYSIKRMSNHDRFRLLDCCDLMFKYDYTHIDYYFSNFIREGLKALQKQGFTRVEYIFPQDEDTLVLFITNEDNSEIRQMPVYDLDSVRLKRYVGRKDLLGITNIDVEDLIFCIRPIEFEDDQE